MHPPPPWGGSIMGPPLCSVGGIAAGGAFKYLFTPAAGKQSQDDQGYADQGPDAGQAQQGADNNKAQAKKDSDQQAPADGLFFHRGSAQMTQCRVFHGFSFRFRLVVINFLKKSKKLNIFS